NATGGFSYTPDPDFSGTDTFTYQASATTKPGSTTTATTSAIAGLATAIGMPCFLNPDGSGNAICPPIVGTDDIATVTIFVRPPRLPRGPVARADSHTAAENTPLGVPPPGVLANDYIRLPDPQPLAANAIAQPLPPTFPLNAVLVTDVSHGMLTLNPDGSF